MSAVPYLNDQGSLFLGQICELRSSTWTAHQQSYQLALVLSFRFLKNPAHMSANCGNFHLLNITNLWRGIFLCRAIEPLWPQLALSGTGYAARLQKALRQDLDHAETHTQLHVEPMPVAPYEN